MAFAVTNVFFYEISRFAFGNKDNPFVQKFTAQCLQRLDVYYLFMLEIGRYLLKMNRYVIAILKMLHLCHICLRSSGHSFLL